MNELKKEDVIFPTEMCNIKTVPTKKCSTVRTAPNNKAVRRIDSGEVLGIVGSNYKIISNGELIEGVENAFDSLGLTYEPSIFTNKSMSQLYLKYNLPDVSFQLSNNGEINATFILINSYDGTERAGLDMEIYNSKRNCYYTFGQKLIKLSQLHTKRANIQKIIDVVQTSVDFFNNEVFPKFEKMIDTTINYQKGITTIDGIKEVLPEKYYESIKANWKTNAHANVWDFYSAFTDVITNEVKSIKRQRILNDIAWSVVGKLV